MQTIKPHLFIAKEQNSFLDNLKTKLRKGEWIIQGDFAENYSFVTQDQAQAFHWNKDTATLHPFVVYHKENDEIQCMSFAMISDEFHHTTTAVYSFQCKLISHLKSILPDIRKIYYFSDGCAEQYKNRKNFISHFWDTL